MPTELKKALYQVKREDGKLVELHDEERANKDLDFSRAFNESDSRYKNKDLATVQAKTLAYINSDHFQQLKKQLQDSAPEGHPAIELAYDSDIKILDKDYRDVLKDLVQQYPDERICVHNPASRFQAFGAWILGARAMEEQITRASDLVNYHKAGSYKEDERDRAYYMTDVFFWRDSQGNKYNPLIEAVSGEKSFKIKPGFAIADVATAPSMDMRPHALKPEWLVEEIRLEEIRIRFENYVVKPAIERGVQHLVFCGAGCGAYQCDSNEVASVYAKVLKKYKRHFKTITGALYGGDLAEKFRAVFDEEVVAVKDVLAVGMLRPVTSPSESESKRSCQPKA